MTDLRDWEGVRVRIQRHSDARFYGGWLVSSRGGITNIRLNQKATFFSGDAVSLEAMGYKSVLAKAHCLSCVGNLLSLTLDSEPVLVPSREPMRMISDEMPGTIIVRNITYPIKVVDIGLEGVGILCERQFDKGDEASLEIRSLRGVIRTTATVRFCRLSENGLDGYRIGLHLTSLDSRSAALWHELFRPAA